MGQNGFQHRYVTAVLSVSESECSKMHTSINVFCNHSMVWRDYHFMEPGMRWVAT